LEPALQNKKGWPSPLQLYFERALIIISVLVFAYISFSVFYKGQIRGDLAIPRYKELGIFEDFKVSIDEFDLNKGTDNFPAEEIDPNKK
jgi:hypothetical protein